MHDAEDRAARQAFAASVAAFLAVVGAILMLAWPIGCTPPVAPSIPDAVTPGGIEVHTGGHQIDLVQVDADFAEQAACFDYHDWDRPIVRIADPVRYQNGCGVLEGNAYGYGGTHSVTVAPDLCALPHEFAEWMYYQMHGRWGEHGWGCGL